MTIFVIPIEQLDQRYTMQWFEDIPNILRDECQKRGLSQTVRTIAGKDVSGQTTKGAFLDFAATNYYKGTQVAAISELFSVGEVKASDKFLVTDAWNFAVTAIRYMSELMGVPVELHAIWHAGAYDPSDILGMKMGKAWSAHQERAWFYACDANYFGTEFHRSMFLGNLDIPSEHHDRAIRSGQPHIQAMRAGQRYFGAGGRGKTILFPHRVNADKQPEIFRDLTSYLPSDWECVITQDHDFSKAELYQQFSRSKIVFSCSLHENLGISQMEGLVCGCIPVVPDRASYRQMYFREFRYPTEWATNWRAYVKHRSKLVAFLVALMDRHEELHAGQLVRQKEAIENNFMYPAAMVTRMLGPIDDEQPRCRRKPLPSPPIDRVSQTQVE